jgi:uncharacterized protein (TIGR03067 family)
MQTATIPHPSSKESTRKELERLQGAWNFVSGGREVELLIAGSSYTVRFKNGPIYMGTFHVDPHVHPKTMDMLVTEGPARHQWKTALCIYELDGSRLRWCPCEPGVQSRLAAFPLENEPDFCCTLFQRERG